MKIALLNLPLDNNYGGNLQRFALMKILNDLGYEVVHIYLVNDDRLYWFSYPCLYVKGFVKKYLLHKNHSVSDDLNRILTYKKRLEHVLPFYEKYIKHSERCVTVKDVKRISLDYDSFIVGSDQIWRKDMTHSLGWENFLFSFLNGKKDVKKIAYGASFGNNKNLYSKSDQVKFKYLYSNFDAVSVREDDAISILSNMGCNNPIPTQVLDPTLLLDKSVYEDLIKGSFDKQRTDGKIFCYVLDKSSIVDNIVAKKSKELGIDALVMGITVNDEASIPTWLKCIHDATFVITDSYHGVVFSILFNKQFVFCGNAKRGNSRVESLFRMLEINPEDIDYSTVNNNIRKWRKKSIGFLKEALM